jgi:predicted MFS family arabinose efflux permease
MIMHNLNHEISKKRPQTTQSAGRCCMMPTTTLITHQESCQQHRFVGHSVTHHNHRRNHNIDTHYTTASMQFGKKLLLLRHPPWALYYLDYARLKEILLGLDQPQPKLQPLQEDEAASVYYQKQPTDIADLTYVFRYRLDAEIETIVLFLVQEQGGIAYRLQDLLMKQRLIPVMSQQSSSLTETPAPAPAPPSLEDSQELENLSNELYKIAEHLLHLVQFIDLNVTGIRKILKKHDKITRTRLSSIYLSHKNDNLSPLLRDDTIATLVKRLEEVWREQQIRLDVDVLPPPLGLVGYQGRSMNKSNTTRIKASVSTGALTLSSHQHPVQTMISMITAARRRLKQSNEFALMLSAPFMLADSESDSPSDDMPGEDEFDDYEPPSRLSNVLNLMSTFLYMTNYYIVAPTSGSYAQKLGGNVALAGIIIGMTPVAALVSTVLYSWWTSYSYKSALIFASTCSLLGNLMYAMGLPCNSLTYVLVGRLLNGFGSARSINRRYVADVFSKQDRTAASAAFVTAGALGMAAGPAVASALHLTVTNPMNDYWQVENSPGWFMAAVWAIYLVCMIWCFEDPPRRHHASDLKERESNGGGGVVVVGEEQPLLALMIGEEVVEKVKRPPLWKNIPVMTTFLIYCALKMVLESSLSSSSTLTNLYFGWSSQFVGLYLSALGLLMLPANLVVAYLARSYDDRELILGMLGIMLAGCLVVMKYGEVYTEGQYVLGSVILFISATALEGPNMSLLSKTIPPEWSKGIFNVGLLATESGTAGRALADLFLTFSGSRGLDHLLNLTFGSLSVITCFTIAIAACFFDHLEPLDMDD